MYLMLYLLVRCQREWKRQYFHSIFKMVLQKKSFQPLQLQTYRVSIHFLLFSAVCRGLKLKIFQCCTRATVDLSIIFGLVKVALKIFANTGVQAVLLRQGSTVLKMYQLFLKSAEFERVLESSLDFKRQII